MDRWTIALGGSAFILALADVIHGQHNGDVHRVYIHRAEFVFFVSFLCLLVAQTFRLFRSKTGLSRWGAAFWLALASCFAGFILFGLAGGSPHGDGGPIAVGFGLFGFLACLPYRSASWDSLSLPSFTNAVGFNGEGAELPTRGFVLWRESIFPLRPLRKM